MKDNHRYCVIMCGGVGSRFWPFSRNDKPKQFLDFFGIGKSLLQLTVDRISPLVDIDNIIFVTNRNYVDLIKEQVPGVRPDNILPEPARRNTAPCVCWAAHHIYAKDPDASVVNLPADHMVLKENDFRQTLEEGFRFVEEGSRLLTIGIKPTYPNTGYGYIQQGKPIEGCPGFFKVKSFTEKPNREMAEQFISSGEFFWNAGIFLWKVKEILEAFSHYAPEINHTLTAKGNIYRTPGEMPFINEVFANCTNISIDYAILEKAENVYVKTGEFGWSDLGSWKALYEASPRNQDANVTQGCKVLAPGCKGTMFAVEGDKIIVAADLEDYIVADTEKALLIFPKNEEQKIRNVVNEVKNRFGDSYL